MNILEVPVIRLRLRGEAGISRATLPQIYELLLADRVEAFPALRRHQRHAWRAMLVQLGALAVLRAGLADIPEGAGEWQGLLGGLTPEWPDGEPWTLAVPDITAPAFFQPPGTSTQTEADYKAAVHTPDDLDVLVTSKNHDVKSRSIRQAEPDDWIMALVTLQTMSGFHGRGNYGISRMNGGAGSRFAFGLSPLPLSWGALVKRDMEAVLERAEPSGETALLWTLQWDGGARESVPVDSLHPLFLEVCRRVRLIEDRTGGLSAVRANSHRPRVDTQGKRGPVADPWALTDLRDKRMPKALTMSPEGFSYRRIWAYLMSPSEYSPSAMMSPTSADLRRPGPSHLEIEGLIGGMGRTGGFHSRSVVLRPRMVAALAAPGGAEWEELRLIGEGMLTEADLLNRILSHAIQVYCETSGKADKLAVSQPWLREMGLYVGRSFFADVQDAFEAPELGRESLRLAWIMDKIREGAEILERAMAEVLCPSELQHSRRQSAIGTFMGRIHGSGGFRSYFEARQALQDDDEEAPRMSLFKSPAPAGYSYLAKRAANIAGYIGNGFACTNGERSELRRMDPDDPRPAVFWRLMAIHDLNYGPELEKKWGLIIHGIALMTRNSGMGFNSSHDGRIPVGKTLFNGGDQKPVRAYISESRLNRLLSSRGPILRDSLVRTWRMLGARGVAFDWREMAALVLAEGHDEEAFSEGLRRIARDYYMAERASIPEIEQNPA